MRRRFFSLPHRKRARRYALHEKTPTKCADNRLPEFEQSNDGVSCLGTRLCSENLCAGV